ncbi:MAG: DUF4184 family protein [Anaerolineae bacterium]|nr:DUF4184 family protein [Anaerolineae bacterium]
MPFTFSHPAAAVPFARLKLPLSALVIGSMVPDSIYFFRFLPGGQFSHTVSGLFLFDIPIGLIALGVFHIILKYPILSLMPANHQERLIILEKSNSLGVLQQFMRTILSLVLGSLTHIVWDSFTHSNGWSVQRISMLNWLILEVPIGSLRMFKVLQHGSTFMGAALLIYWYVKWYRKAPKQSVSFGVGFTSKEKIIIITSISLGAVVWAVIRGIIRMPSVIDFSSLRQFVGYVTVTSISALFIEVVIFSIIWHLVRLNRKVQLFTY